MSRPINFSGVCNFLTQLADDPSLVAWWGRILRRTIIGVVTLQKVIIMRIRGVSHGIHRIKMCIGQTFGDGQRVPSTLPLRLVIDLL